MAKKAPQYLKDESTRIAAIAPLIKAGYIKTWAAIFDTIPRTIVAAHLGVNNTRMAALVADPSTIRLEQLAEIASFLNVEFTVLADLANKGRVKAKGKKG